MHIEIPDWQITRLIQTARYLLRLKRELQQNWLDKYGDMNWCDIPEPYPTGDHYQHYLYVRGVIRDAMKYRRNHRKTVAHIWKVYVDSVLEARGV